MECDFRSCIYASGRVAGVNSLGGCSDTPVTRASGTCAMHRYACSDALMYTYHTCEVQYALRHAQLYACSQARHYLCDSLGDACRPPRVYACNAWLGPHQVGMSMLSLLTSNFHFIFNTTPVFSDDIRHGAHRGQGSFLGHTIMHTGQQHVDGSGGSLIAEFSGQSVHLMQRVQCCLMD